MKAMKAGIGIIGGTGIYDPGMFKNTSEISIGTLYGEPSDCYSIGEFQEKTVAFLPRHGKKHIIPPHDINYKANISGFEKLGVKRILASCATGSLKENYKPGEIVIPDQFIDFKKTRTTFYDTGDVTHVSLADPFCPELRKILIESCEKLGMSYHKKGTYLCIEGPRFSTRAESRMFRNFAELIGMTGVPEAILAREKEICFAIIATITDYDVWAEKPVDIEEVVRVMKESENKVKELVKETIKNIPEERNCFCKDALKNAKV
jgi:5'-methylthioadenosine phosphorylase